MAGLPSRAKKHSHSSHSRRSTQEGWRPGAPPPRSSLSPLPLPMAGLDFLINDKEPEMHNDATPSLIPDPATSPAPSARESVTFDEVVENFRNPPPEVLAAAGARAQRIATMEAESRRSDCEDVLVHRHRHAVPEMLARKLRGVPSRPGRSDQAACRDPRQPD